MTVSQTIGAVRARQPDVCLIDRHFAEDDGIGAVGQILAACPRTKVLILSADGDSEAIMQAMRAGASGYVHKTRGVAVLKQTIERVLRGEVVVEVPSSAAAKPKARPPAGSAPAGRLPDRPRAAMPALAG